MTYYLRLSVEEIIKEVRILPIESGWERIGEAVRAKSSFFDLLDLHEVEYVFELESHDHPFTVQEVNRQRQRDGMSQFSTHGAELFVINWSLCTVAFPTVEGAIKAKLLNPPLRERKDTGHPSRQTVLEDACSYLL